MWNSDFKGRSAKLEREQKLRLENQRLKTEKEKAERDRYQQKLAQHEEEKSRRRAAALAAEEIVGPLHTDPPLGTLLAQRNAESL